VLEPSFISTLRRGVLNTGQRRALLGLELGPANGESVVLVGSERVRLASASGRIEVIA